MVKLERILEQQGIRVTIDSRPETLGYKIREAEIEKIPYILVAGGREEATGAVSVRSRKGKEESTMEMDMLITKLKEEIGGKNL